MFRQIHLRGLGVIGDAVLDLSPGLTVLTGETGAGKTMIVSGLGLLFGQRADSSMVRTGVDLALAEGVLDLADDHPAIERAIEAGADVGDGLIVGRSVTAQGRSRAVVGGRTVPVGVLAEIGELLVSVHGQADQQRLRRPEVQREVLDDFGGADLATALGDYQTCFDRFVATLAEERALAAVALASRRDVEVLRAALEQIEQVDPQPGEDELLRAEDDRLSHADALTTQAGVAHEALSGAEDTAGERSSVLSLLHQAQGALRSVADHDEEAADLLTRLRDLSALSADLAGDLARYAADLDGDPERLAWVQNRRAVVTTLVRRYGQSVDGVLAWAQESAVRIAHVEGAHDRAAELRVDVERQRVDLAGAAARLTEARAAAASALGHLVTTELAALAMSGSALSVVLSHTPDADGLDMPGHGHPLRFTRHGIDEVSLMLTSGGLGTRPVTKSASGGELSRIMLAIEVVCTGSSGGARSASPVESTANSTPELTAGSTAESTGRSTPELTAESSAEANSLAPNRAHILTPTMIFDEVDSGVGGAAAVAVGARLARLARQSQVIVVTHLAQVAAFADNHLVVHKDETGLVTTSSVRAVQGEQRLGELSRMMSGDAESGTGRDHARELVAEATARKA